MGYYFISIGGSGSRVLESLTHLCAAGLLPNDEKLRTLHVMTIDPDTGNGNLNRTRSLLDCLQSFQSLDVGTGTPLLKTHLKLNSPLNWTPTTLNSKLDDVVSYPVFRNQPSGKLYSALYTSDERSTNLNAGFRGHPSIGAAVMAERALTQAQLGNEQAWQNFIAAVKSDVGENRPVKIFLAGSIFGGTGAAGLPTIARLLHDEIFGAECTAGKVRVGGALLLPYFSFTPTPHDIKVSGLFASSDNFLTNTKAALRYYADTGGRGFDAIYFVGDETMTQVKNFSVGAGKQCNDAHIVDLFAAMGALHFFHAARDQHCYSIARKESNKFQWSDLPNVAMEDGTTTPVRQRFVQFTRFIFSYLHIVKPVYAALQNKQESADKHEWYTHYLKDVDVNSKEVVKFEEYAEDFCRWLNQIENSAGGGRSVEIINPKAFAVKNGQTTIDPDLFGTLDYGISDLKINTVMTSIKTKDGGFLDRFFGKKKDKNLGAGFGFFLRKLYDSCAVNAAK